MKRCNGNQVAKAPQDPLSIHGGPMLRVRTKKIKEALNGLMSTSQVHA